MDAGLTFIAVLGANIELFAKSTSPVNQCISLLLQYGDSRALSEALLLPLGQGTVLLVNGTLLPGADFLLFIDAHLERLVLSLECLVGSDDCVDLR